MGLLPEPGLGRLRPRLALPTRPDHDELLQDLRCSLLGPPRWLALRIAIVGAAAKSIGMSVPPPNVTMKPEPRPLSRRLLDAADCSKRGDASIAEVREDRG